MKTTEDIIRANIKGVVFVEYTNAGVCVQTRNVFIKVSKLERLKELTGAKDIEIEVDRNGLLAYVLEM